VYCTSVTSSENKETVWEKDNARSNAWITYKRQITYNIAGKYQRLDRTGIGPVTMEAGGHVSQQCDHPEGDGQQTARTALKTKTGTLVIDFCGIRR